MKSSNSFLKRVRKRRKAEKKATNEALLSYFLSRAFTYCTQFSSNGSLEWSLYNGKGGYRDTLFLSFIEYEVEKILFPLLHGYQHHAATALYIQCSNRYQSCWMLCVVQPHVTLAEHTKKTKTNQTNSFFCRLVFSLSLVVAFAFNDVAVV